MELIVPIAGLVAVWTVAFYNLRQVRRLIADIKALLNAHLRRLERMQNAMAHGVASVHRSLERMRRDVSEGAGVAVLGPCHRHATRVGACHQHARVMLWATSRSRGYRRRSTRSSGGGRRRRA